jgi:hypothetical protein
MVKVAVPGQDEVDFSASTQRSDNLSYGRFIGLCRARGRKAGAGKCLLRNARDVTIYDDTVVAHLEELVGHRHPGKKHPGGF